MYSPPDLSAPPQQRDPMLWVKLAHVCMLLGILSAGTLWIAGLVMAYVFRGDGSAAADSHYTMQIRTFWISILVTIIAIPLILAFGLGLFVLFILWVWQLVRAIRGLRLAIEDRPYPNPTGWGFT